MKSVPPKMCRTYIKQLWDWVMENLVEVDEKIWLKNRSKIRFHNVDRDETLTVVRRFEIERIFKRVGSIFEFQVGHSNSKTSLNINQKKSP